MVYSRLPGRGWEPGRGRERPHHVLCLDPRSALLQEAGLCTWGRGSAVTGRHGPAHRIPAG